MIFKSKVMKNYTTNLLFKTVIDNLLDKGKLYLSLMIKMENPCIEHLKKQKRIET